MEARRIRTKSGRTLGVLIPSSAVIEDIQFFTDDDMVFQIGGMTRPTNYEIDPHFHTPVDREISGTREVLIVRSGVIEVDFYETTDVIVESVRMTAGDLLYLNDGGHGVRFIEKAVVLEVKQGPYVAGNDKARFKRPTVFPKN